MISDILTSFAGNIPTLLGLLAAYMMLKHLIREEFRMMEERIQGKIITLNAMRNLNKF